MVIAAPKTYTPEDLLTMPDGDRYELVDGQLKEHNKSALSSYVSGLVLAALMRFVKTSKLGWVFPDTSFQCFAHHPNLVRRVEMAYIAPSRMTAEQVRTQGHITIVPDIVLVIISPWDLAYDVSRKIEGWLTAGVKIVWVIDPETKIILVHRPDGSTVKLRVANDMTAEDLLPGSHCPIASLFP